MEHDARWEEPSDVPSAMYFISDAGDAVRSERQSPDAPGSLRFSGRVPDSGLSNITVEEFYAGYLRRTYPYHNEVAIQETVRAAMRQPQVRENLENMLHTELEILRENPGWSEGWLTLGASAEPVNPETS